MRSTLFNAHAVAAALVAVLLHATAFGALAQEPSETAQPVAPPGIAIRALVDEALEANPELTAMRREFDAARARVPQAKALPDPTLNLATMTQTNPIPFTGIDGMFGEVTVGVRQTVPWFGIRRLRGQVASEEARAKLEAYEAAALRLAADVKATAFELYAVDKTLAVLDRDLDILDRIAKVAEARYEVGKGQQVDLINARLEITELLDRKGELEARRGVGAARLNMLLFRDPTAPVGPIAGPSVTGDVPPLDELVQLASERSPDLQEKRRRIDARSHALRLAEREAKYPEVTFDFAYRRRPGIPADFYSYGVSLRLPLYAFTKQRYGIEERAAELAAARSRLESTGAMVKNRLADAYVRATTALRLIRLHEQGLVPQSTLALESALSAYQVGEVDFQTLLVALKKAVDYEIHYYDLWAEYQTALAEMEVYAGTELVR